MFAAYSACMTRLKCPTWTSEAGSKQGHILVWHLSWIKTGTCFGRVFGMAPVLAVKKFVYAKKTGTSENTEPPAQA